MNWQQITVGLENILYRVDIVGWLDYLHGVTKHGRLTRLEWGATGGYEIESTLRRYAIHAYGRGIAVELEPGPDGTQRRVYRRWLWVNAKQAAWAEYVLLRAGVSLRSVIDPANVQRAQQHDSTPAPWQGGRRGRAVTPVEGLVDLFGSLMGYDDDNDVQPVRRRERRRERSRR